MGNSTSVDDAVPVTKEEKREKRIIEYEDKNKDNPKGEDVSEDDVKKDDEKTTLLLIIGGYDGNSDLNSVEELLNTANNKSSNMQEKRCWHCATVINGQVYVAGGYNGTSYLGSVERYDPRVVGKKEWTLLPGEMNTYRCECAAAAGMDGRLLYIMGGWDEHHNELDSMEVYDTKLQSWSIVVARMGSKRRGCAAVSYGGEIYVFGGHDGSIYLNSGEVFDPMLNKWSALPGTMNTGRSHCAAAVVNDKIYVAGGGIGSDDGKTTLLNSVEVYDPGAGTFSVLSKPMHSRRNGCAATSMGGKVYVVGGYNVADTYLDTVEVYDPATTEKGWKVMTMGSKREGCAAAVAVVSKNMKKMRVSYDK